MFCVNLPSGNSSTLPLSGVYVAPVEVIIRLDAHVAVAAKIAVVAPITSFSFIVAFLSR